MEDPNSEPDDFALRPEEYTLIGRIVVRSGHLEAQLKYLPLFLLDERRVCGLAMTAHLNFVSLADLGETLLEDCVSNPGLREQFRKAIGLARTAYAERNIVVHGPISDWGDGVASTFNLTARGTLKSRGHFIAAKHLQETLDEIEVAEAAIRLCWDTLREERAQQGLYRPGAPIRWADKKASPQTREPPPQSERG